jgi:hypothetical protein
VVEPVLFRVITLTLETQLTRLAARITQHTRPDRKDDVPAWIHEINVAIPSFSSYDTLVDLLATVLIHTHRLREFRFHHHPLRTSQICCINRIAGSQLRTFHVHLSTISEACIPLIGQLDSLHDLRMWFDASRPPLLAQTSPLSLPQLRRISIHWTAPFTSQAARFLFSSTFKQVEVSEMVVTTLTQEFTPNLVTYLTDRDRPLEHLYINIPLALVPSVTEGLLRCTKRLSFPAYTPQDTFLNAWSSYSPLRSLTVCTPTPLNPGDLRPLLDKLTASSDERFKKSEFSLIIVIFNGKFSWDSGPQDATMGNFVGALVYYARLLRRKGVRLLDSGEHTLFD